jgi:hypothetical protein
MPYVARITLFTGKEVTFRYKTQKVVFANKKQWHSFTWLYKRKFKLIVRQDATEHEANLHLGTDLNKEFINKLNKRATEVSRAKTSNDNV